MNLQKEVIISAFLVDFDRFYKKETKPFFQTYKSIFQKYCDTQKIEEIISGVLEHKSHSKEIRCVAQAREISLTQTDKSEGTDQGLYGKNLTSVFFRVNINEGSVCRKGKYQLKPLTPNGCFPTDFSKNGAKSQQKLKEKNDTAHKELIQQFEQEMNNFKENAPETFEQFLIPFEALLKKYLWCITASDYEGEDISLYDHGRITAAIANCLYRMDEQNTTSYKLVAGNFSGIQKYIFSLSSVNTTSVAKKLRARSFFVDATVGAFAQYIIDEFQVPRFHILMLTGGKFYILLPNTKGSDEKMQQIEQDVEKALFERFKGQLSTNLAYINVGRDGLEQYDNSIYQLSEALDAKKREPFHLVLSDECGWMENSFVLEKDLQGRNCCTACRSFFKPTKAQEQCDICNIQDQLGKVLPNASYIAYYKEKQVLSANEFEIFLGYTIGILKEKEIGASDKELKEAYYLEKIDNSNIDKQLFRYPVTFEYRGNHIPLDEQNVPQSFDKLATSVDGKDYIAVLKADVDNLGYIFASGLKKKERHYGTISRVNTMSRLLTVFFSGKVQELLREQNGTEPCEYEKVYSVFAGGDDLFLIGPWSKMPELAIKINDEFRKFVCENQDITLSATVDLFHPKTHIATMAKVSEEHLSEVKNLQEHQVKKECRNGVYLFGQVFGWEQFEQHLNNGRMLAELIAQKDTVIDTTLLRRICEYSQMYQGYLQNGKAESLRYKPMLYYVLNRKEPQMRDSNEKSCVKQYLDSLNVEGENVNQDLYYASSTMLYALTKTRGGN